MAYTIYQGDLLPALVFTATSQPSGAAVELTGATCSVLFGPTNGQAGFVGAGTGTILGNVYTYQLATADTATAGTFQVQLEAVFPGSLPQHFSPQIVVIQAPVA